MIIFYLENKKTDTFVSVFRGTDHTQPLSEKELKKQIEELGILGKEANTQPLTSEQIQKQKEELDNIKQQLK